jgi:MoaA/NifB/PqqE/SkfB family radical SAM enzyme
MNRQCLIDHYQQNYQVIGNIDLDQWAGDQFFNFHYEMPDLLKQLYQPVYQNNQRILFTINQYNFTKHTCQDLLCNLQILLNQVDISNYFVEILIDDTADIDNLQAEMLKNSIDPVPILFACYHSDHLQQPESKSLDKEFLLNKSKTFCIYPWTHLYVQPTGDIGLCCVGKNWVGNLKDHSLEEIWNQQAMKNIRLSMLSDSPVSACRLCYESESVGANSLRKIANNTFKHHIDRIDQTQHDGTVKDFKLIRWDVRFNNLCNLKCRTCHHVCSSSWHQDLAKLDPSWVEKNPKAILFAGKYQTDVWEQVMPHLDYAEQIYFAGGEPLMMDEHFLILEELERKQRFDVKLFYNTNFTHVQLKDRAVFDYWKKFKNVEVGASLDGSGDRGEYIRKGTNWDIIIKNRQRMMEICPNVQFYVTPTASILNVLHLPEFHREWVELGLIKPDQLYVGLLREPLFYRIDIANHVMREKIQQQYQEHLNWLEPQDPVGRATQSFKAVLKFMQQKDNTKFLKEFWEKTVELDTLRNESILDKIPELEILKL